MLSILKKNCELIIASGNDYLGALKGNQPGLLADVKTHFIPEDTDIELSKGHGRLEKRIVSICQTPAKTLPKLATRVLSLSVGPRDPG